jgi:hypothetical protein
MDDNTLRNLAILAFVTLFYAPSPYWVFVIKVRMQKSILKTILLNSIVLIVLGLSLNTLIHTWASSSWSITVFALLAISAFLALLFIAAYSSPRSAHHNVRSPRQSNARREYIRIPYMYGESGNVSVVFTNATASVDKKQTRCHPDAEYSPWLVEELENKQKIFAVTRNAQLICPACDTILPPDFAASQTIESEIQYRDFDPFTLRITIPAVKCSACGKMCAVEVNGNERFNLYEAMVRAFASEQIKP